MRWVVRDGYLGAFLDQVWITLQQYGQSRTVRIVGLSEGTHFSMITAGMTVPDFPSRIRDAIGDHLKVIEMSNDDPDKEYMWETFVGHDDEMKNKYHVNLMPRRIGMAPSANFALHLDPNRARTPEQREKFKEFLMIDTVHYDKDMRAAGRDARATLSSSDATRRKGRSKGTLDLDDFYVLMTNRTMHVYQKGGQDATRSCDQLCQFANGMMGTVPHISFERGTRGYPEPYLESRDQSGVYRLHKHHIMGILSTLSPIWADQANRGMITGPACTTMEHLTKTYPSWSEDEWKFNLPLVESNKRAKG